MSIKGFEAYSCNVCPRIGDKSIHKAAYIMLVFRMPGRTDVKVNYYGQSPPPMCTCHHTHDRIFLVPSSSILAYILKV